MNVAEKLSREVARCAALRQRYFLTPAAYPNDDVGARLQAVLSIETLLEGAHVAAGSGDILACMGAAYALQQVPDDPAAQGGHTS